jgi:hypothetical protein
MQLGLPVLGIGVGLAMTGYVNFWLGIAIAALAVVVLLLDLWRLVRNGSFLKKGMAFSIGIICVGLITWIAFRPVPLGASFALGPGNYPENSEIGGIKWEKGFSDVRLILSNDTKLDFGNIDLTVKTNQFIAKIGSMDAFSQCKSAPIDQMHVTILSLDITDASGKKQTILGTPAAAKSFRVHCDVLLSGDDIHLVIALLNVNAFKNGQRPDTLFAPPENARWAMVDATYDAAGRTREEIHSTCFGSKESCGDIGEEDKNFGPVFKSSIP